MRTEDMTIDFLQSMRMKTDPVADKVISEIIASNNFELNDLFNHLRKNRDIDHNKLPVVARNYFKEYGVLPSWVDKKKLLIGQEVFQKHGIEVSMLLFYLSLPVAYACWRGAKVLYSTGRLIAPHKDTKRFTRRLMETSQYVVDVMAPGAFDTEGNAIVASLKVRLIHAAIRYYILDKTEWDKESYGEPLNQEDKAGTLQSFSSMIIQGLEKMDINLSKEEREGYYHCWHVAGHFAGLLPELNPDNYEDGLALGFKILNHQKGNSEEGDQLTEALVDFVNEKLPGKLFDDYFPIYMINHFIGESLDGVLKFKKTPKLIGRIMDFLVRNFSFFLSFFGIDKKSIVVRRVKMTKDKFVQSLITHFNHDKNVYFDIPPSLKKNWKVDDKGNLIGIDPLDQ